MSVLSPHLMALCVSCLLLGACSSIETSRKTHLNDPSKSKQAQEEFYLDETKLTPAQQTQLDLENEAKLKARFAGGFKDNKNSDGTAKMSMGSRSAFESGKYRENGNELLGKDFNTKGFDTKSFEGGGKKFETSEWKKKNSLTDINLETPEFAKKKSDVQNGKSDYMGKEYAGNKNAADESGKNWNQLNDIKNPEHLMNEYTLEKRDSLERPHVMSMKEYQKKTVEDVRAMLGRDD